MTKGLFTFDIDGTLTPKIDDIDKRVVDRLAKLVEDGFNVALVTGRVFAFAQKTILDKFPFPHFLAVQNGADIFQMPERKLLKRSYLPASILPEIEACYEGEKEDFIIYMGIDAGDYCTYRPKNFSPRILEHLKVLEGLGGQPWQESDFQFSDGTEFPLIKCFGEKKAMEGLYQRLKRVGGIEVSLIPDPIDPSLYLNLITHEDANKGGVVRFLKKTTGAPFSIGAGDEGNDIKMLQEADIAIAIETAPEDVIREADIIAKRPSEFGIIDAIEEALSRATQ